VGGGIDLAMAELLCEWRTKHPGATQKDIVQFLIQISSTYEFHERKWSKELNNKPLTEYILLQRKLPACAILSKKV
jgi:uncharacterized alpha-E superfamily protein